MSASVELAYWRISVSAICPTFHRTNLLAGLPAKFDHIWQVSFASVVGLFCLYRRSLLPL